MSNHSSILIIVLTASLVSGCATIPKEAGLRDVEKMAGTREDITVSETIHSMMREQLTVDQAVQIALLNNPSLQATLEELGIAQADLAQAGLLQNPVFSGHVRFPEDSSSSTNTEFSVTQNFLDLLFLPLRKKLAAEQFEQAKLRVGDAVIRLSAEVKSAYYTTQGAQQMLTMRRTVVEAALAASELAERQYKAGTINQLELANQQASTHQAKLDLAQSEAEALLDRERLNRLMGLSGADGNWQMVGTLPELPQTETPLEELEALAISQRLDLAAARKEITIFERTLSLTRLGVVPSVEVGIDTEKDPDGTRVTGPSWEVEAPIFDRRQTAVARNKARLRQAKQRLLAFEADVRSEVRSTQVRLLAARKTAESYQESIIPLRTQIVELEQQQYNYMLRGVYQLLLAKQNEVIAHRDYIGALRDYWIAWSDLERAVGGKLDHHGGER